MARVTRRHPACIIGMTGPGGAGKTWNSLHAPGPIEVVSVDPNTRFVIEEVFGEENPRRLGEFEGCTLHEVKMPALAFAEKDEVEEAAGAIWDQLIDEFRPLVLDTKPEDAGTVVFDTADEIYNIAVMGVFGKTDKIHPEQRKNQLGTANTKYKQLIVGLRDAGWVVVLLHRPREVWVDAVERQGNQIKDVRKRLDGPFDWEKLGYKDTNTLVSIDTVCAFDYHREGRLGNKYGLKYTKNTHRPLITGTEQWGRIEIDDEIVAGSSVTAIGLQSFPGTTKEQWS